MVIDKAGKNLGELDTRRAIEMAHEQELDLVEVSPQLNPPVCKIMDYGKHRYKIAKQNRQHNARQKKVELKGIRISVRAEEHDLNFKAENAIKFMSKGHRVKLDIFLRGREKANLDFARRKFETFVERVKTLAKTNEKTAEKEIVEVQKLEKSPQGFNLILEFKRN